MTSIYTEVRKAMIESRRENPGMGLVAARDFAMTLLSDEQRREYEREAVERHAAFLAKSKAAAARCMVPNCRRCAVLALSGRRRAG